METHNAHAVDRPVFAHADITAALQGAVRKALDTVWIWHWRARTRRQLLTLGDRMLADIGVSRVDASREAAKPFWQA